MGRRKNQKKGKDGRGKEKDWEIQKKGGVRGTVTVRVKSKERKRKTKRESEENKEEAGRAKVTEKKAGKI
jgi:hypothetical protein